MKEARSTMTQKKTKRMITGHAQAPSTPARGTGTAEAIIDAAIQLWGARGVDGASLREISIAAGSANNSSIGYHFGDRRGLIEAIFRARIPGLEERRKLLLEDARARGLLDDPLTLIEITYQPVFDEIDAQGCHSFAAFLRAVNRFSEWDGKAWTQELAPSAFLVMQILMRKANHVPQPLFDARVRLINEICYGAITDQDKNQSRAPDAALAKKIFQDGLKASAHLLFLDV